MEQAMIPYTGITYVSPNKMDLSVNKQEIMVRIYHFVFQNIGKGEIFLNNCRNSFPSLLRTLVASLVMTMLSLLMMLCGFLSCDFVTYIYNVMPDVIYCYLQQLSSYLFIDCLLQKEFKGFFR